MMNRKIIGGLAAVPFVLGGSVAATPVTSILHSDYRLTSEALVMIPAFNQEWLDLSNKLYLEPNGFHGTPEFLQVPETYDLNASLKGATENIVNAVEQHCANDGCDADNPLYIFGYSQSNAAAGLAEEQLAGKIPSDALHFVMVGDSASAHGGFLNEFMDTLLSWFPESWRQSVIDFVDEFATANNANDALGLTTPENLYPTDIYTLTGDGWGNWDNGANIGGMFSEHLAYLGLTPDEINSAAETTHGLTTYYTIDSDDVDMFSALAKSLEMITSPFI